MITLKNAAEIKQMETACKISAQALAHAGKFMQEGISTFEIDEEIRKFIVGTGAKPNFLGLYGFPASACISVNEEIIHGIPSKSKILKNGDIVSVDTGAFYDGFNGDNAFTFTVGEVEEEVRLLLQRTQESLMKGIAAAKPGNRIGDISFAIQSHVEQFGYGVVREYVGHGVGRKLHEDPEVPNFGKPGRGPRLAPGMTLAIEPMINLSGAGCRQLSNGWTVVTTSGKASAHFEHTVVITNDGARILTQP